MLFRNKNHNSRKRDEERYCFFKNDAKDTAEELIHEGRYGTTVFYDKDRNFKRWLLMKYMFHNYYARYKKYYEVNKGQYFKKNN